MALLGPEARGCFFSGCGRVGIAPERSVSQSSDSYLGFAIVGALGLWIRHLSTRPRRLSPTGRATERDRPSAEGPVLVP